MLRSAEIWLPGYLKSAKARKAFEPGDTLCLAIADHFEPYWGKAKPEEANARMRAWEERLPRLAHNLEDSRGRPIQHDFFYPLDEYDPRILDRLAALCEKGLGEVEIHLHHHGETPDELTDVLARGADTYFTRHGLLRKSGPEDKIKYGFIHGNWALDNSLPDGSWCGVNNELDILVKTGCYADFTMPAAPSPAQTSTVNSIYYATDDPEKPKSHNTGKPARVGETAPEGDLLLVQGVLALNWQRRKWGVLPKLENSDLSGHNPPSTSRLKAWMDNAPYVQGAEKVRFLKLHCHGGPQSNHEALLGDPILETMGAMRKIIEEMPGCRLLYMTCWEMAQAIHSLEQGNSI